MTLGSKGWMRIRWGFAGLFGFVFSLAFSFLSYPGHRAWTQEKPHETLVAAKTTEGPEPADLIEKGKERIKSFGCVVCHEIPNMETTIRQEAPDLSFEGDKVRPEWLFAFLKSPYTIRPFVKGRMPNLRLSDEEALAITEFVMSLKDKGAPEVPEKARFAGGFPAEHLKAADVLTSKDYFNCFNCHVRGSRNPEGPPEDWAPDLTRARARLQANWIIRWIEDPQKLRPGTKMPTFLGDPDSGPPDILEGDEIQQIAALRDFVLSLGQEMLPFEAEYQYQKMKQEHPEITAAMGRSLVVKVNCIGCHEIAILPQGKQVAPPLTHEGSRVKKEWLRSFIKEPWTIKPEYSIMGSEARMPNFRMTDEELAAVVAYISNALVDQDVPPVTARLGPAELVPLGEKLFYEKYECKNCHRIGDKAGGIGPILTAAGERLNSAWVRKFIRDPRYFLPKTRMPNLKVSEEDAQVLAAYVTSPIK